MQDSAKGYEPLTDDEKDALSDSEVEKWEQKIKDSLLRRDESLEKVMNAMTSSMSKGYEVNGKTYYLSNFGIKTLATSMRRRIRNMHTILTGTRMTPLRPEMPTS